MTDHLPECPAVDLEQPAHPVVRDNCYCDRLRACEQRMLDKVIERAELTFRSDIINPVRDIIEPMLEGK